jgi:hypothetical protein
MAHDFQKVPVGPVRGKPQHRSHGRIGQHETTGRIDEDHALDHAAQDRVDARAFAPQIGQARAQVPRGRVQQTRGAADFVTPVLIGRMREIALPEVPRGVRHALEAAVQPAGRDLSQAPGREQPRDETADHRSAHA